MSGIVTWHLPNPRTGELYKKPFATSSIDDALVISSFRHLTWRAMLNTVTGLNGDVRAVAKGFIDAGHGDNLISELVDEL